MENGKKMNEKKINIGRIIEFIIPEWFYMSISLLNGILFVVFNSLSIWLTATLINNVLMDFDQLVRNHEELLVSDTITINVVAPPQTQANISICQNENPIISKNEVNLFDPI